MKHNKLHFFIPSITLIVLLFVGFYIVTQNCSVETNRTDDSAFSSLTDTDEEISTDFNILPAEKQVSPIVSTHNYIVSPVGHMCEVYNTDTGLFGYRQIYIHHCSDCGEYYYSTSYVWTAK